MSSPRVPKKIAIIGAGFSGTLAAINLARLSGDLPMEISLIERRGTFGPGLAYSPPSDRFKLNVRAKAMGALPDEPEAFSRWLKTREPTASPDDFISRRLYGEYLTDLLEQTITQTPHIPIHKVYGDVVSLSYNELTQTFVIGLSDGSSISAHACILAIGNLLKKTLGKNLENTSFRAPYSPESYTDVAHLKSLVIAGAGLTAVDVILETQGLGFQGTYTVVSRHGRFPLPHEDPSNLQSANLPEGWERCGSVTQLLRLVRQHSKQLSSSQPVFDAMRPRIQAMWKNLSLAERHRFLRHVRPFWEIHRHRIPAEHARILKQLTDQHRLKLIAGRVTSMHPEGNGCTVNVALRGKGHSKISIQGDAIFLCAGAEGNLEQVPDPLVQNLVRQNLLTAGPLKLGGIIPQGAHTPLKSRNVWLLGPLQRETCWEITAVRELREEARAIAEDVIASLYDKSKIIGPKS